MAAARRRAGLGPWSCPKGAGSSRRSGGGMLLVEADAKLEAVDLLDVEGELTHGVTHQ